MINRKLNIIYWCDWEAFSFLSCSWSLMNWKLHTSTHMTSWCGIFLFYLEDWGKWVIMCPSLVIFLEGEASSLQLTLINRLYENKGAKSNKPLPSCSHCVRGEKEIVRCGEWSLITAMIQWQPELWERAVRGLPLMSGEDFWDVMSLPSPVLLELNVLTPKGLAKFLINR